MCSSTTLSNSNIYCCGEIFQRCRHDHGPSAKLDKSSAAISSAKLDIFAKFYNTYQRLQQVLPSGKDGYDLEYETLTRHDLTLKETPGEFYTARLPHNINKNRYDDVLASMMSLFVVSRVMKCRAVFSTTASHFRQMKAQGAKLSESEAMTTILMRISLTYVVGTGSKVEAFNLNVKLILVPNIES